MLNIKLPDPKQFNFKDCLIGKDECVLITPKDMGVEWTEENKYFRSSIWRKKDLKPMSLGFRKFMNYGEKPDFEPLKPKSSIKVVQKIDGSCLIVSNPTGKLIVRTRGTVDASVLPNGHEIEFLKTKYPKAFKNEWLNCGVYTLLFEWTTPSNRIVLKESDEPTLWLIGMVDHINYRYVDQMNLDAYAKKMKVERPKTFEIALDGDIDYLKNKIEPLKDIEGVVMYEHLEGQILKKLKTTRYLYLHRIFTGVKTVDNLFDVWKQSDFLFYYEFKEWLETQYDHELVVSLDKLIHELFVIRDSIVGTYRDIVAFTQENGFSSLTRKEQAQKILAKWDKWSPIAFEVLDDKEFNMEKMYKIWKSKKN